MHKRMAGNYQAGLDEDALNVYLQNSCFDCKRTGGIYGNGDYWAGGGGQGFAGGDGGSVSSQQNPVPRKLFPLTVTLNH